MGERDAVTPTHTYKVAACASPGCEKGGTLYKAMLRVLMKLPLLSFKAMEEDDLQAREGACDCCLGCETFRGACAFLSPTRNLHVHLGVVDEVLQRVSARVEVLQLCVVGDCADSGVEGSDHPADVDRLDVGEVGEDSSSRSTGGLREY